TWLVTAGAQAIAAGDDAGIAQAPLWGVGRVLRTERGSGCRLVDIGSRRAAADVDALLAELEAPARPGEDEVALRDGQRFVRRLCPAVLPPTPRDGAALSPDEASFRARIARPGALESLCLRAETPAAPGAGEVEIRVVAAALNFRDVLLALGMGFAAGGEDPAQAAFGWECAGVVVACGAGVDGLAPGDDLVALAGGALGSRVITRAVLVARKPAALSFEQAATLPVGFLSARWALERIARLTGGERALIHCASGGVGLAAVQVARRAGAEVLATAGREDKRAHLRALGIEHVMDSRTLRFADEVRAATGGEGVDVVLNSLAGEAIDRSLEILRPFGRFVEIGKRAIYEGGRLALAPFRNNLSYFALDLHPVYADQPEVIGTMLREVVADVERGELEPLPHHAYDLAALEPAFRLMAQARHIGKVVVTVRESAYDVVPAAAPAPLLRADGAYVVTGGLGGFGLQVAQWMVREGAGHVVLAGRSGKPRDEDLPALEALLTMGADVHVERADVSDASATGRLLAHVRDCVAPLRGVVHAAMVLDDALLGMLDYPRFETALAPKLAGAWNLHALTAGDELDLFVCFSSISLLIGQASQAGYAAGNAFLAALGAHRRARGLPALTVDWGTIAGAGYVARQPGLEARLRRAGLAGIAAADACAMLGELLRRDVARMAVSPIDWGADEAAAAAAAPQRPSDAREASHELRARLRAAPPDERAALVEDYLRETTAVVLETSAERVEVDRPLPDMGIDSLMAVELRTAIRADLGVEVPIVDLLERFSLRALAAAVAERAGA
ncbi:MAG TPA: SDR family NAD(P)-dependent oxidoreductase, partial [Solirubrobacteraceae bacterium]|nr:SDR family NAD(P)-dependent oxidoreductase [Solirubrobacteraceae bacterium]